MIKRTFFKCLTIKLDRWPGQVRPYSGGERYGWRKPDGMGRFGGGWNYCLGFETGGFGPHGITIMFNLLLGMIMVSYISRSERKRIEEKERKHNEDQAAFRQEAIEKRWYDNYATRKAAEASAGDDIPF